MSDISLWEVHKLRGMRPSVLIGNDPRRRGMRPSVLIGNPRRRGMRPWIRRLRFSRIFAPGERLSLELM